MKIVGKNIRADNIQYSVFRRIVFIDLLLYRLIMSYFLSFHKCLHYLDKHEMYQN